MGELGRLLMLIGAVLLAIGGLLTLAGKLPWLGHLPGDIVVERGRLTFYFPLATSLIVSLILSLLFWFFRR